MALLGLAATGPISRFVWGYYVAACFAVTGMIVLLFLCRYRSRRILRCLLGSTARFHAIAQPIRGLAGWFLLPPLSLGATVLVIVLAFGVQSLNVIGSYLTARAMHIAMSPVDWAAITTIVAVVQVLPLSIGGLGVRENLLAAILTLYGIPVARSVAYSLTGFAIGVVLILFVWCVMELPGIPKTMGEVDRSDHRSTGLPGQQREGKNTTLTLRDYARFTWQRISGARLPLKEEGACCCTEDVLPHLKLSSLWRVLNLANEQLRLQYGTAQIGGPWRLRHWPGQSWELF